MNMSSSMATPFQSISKAVAKAGAPKIKGLSEDEKINPSQAPSEVGTSAKLRYHRTLGNHGD
jgi:hypothetical protein